MLFCYLSRQFLFGCRFFIGNLNFKFEVYKLQFPKLKKLLKVIDKVRKDNIIDRAVIMLIYGQQLNLIFKKGK